MTFDITDRVFGNLTVVAPLAMRKGGKVIWECSCNCNKNTCPKIVFVISNDLLRGKTKSCQRQQFNKSIHPAIRKYFGSTRCRALDRNLVFELTLEEFIAIIKQPCKYCNSNTDIRRMGTPYFPNRALRANGIDRWNNSLGYTLENSVPCCETCNRAKLQMSAQQYIDHCRNVVKNNE